ncbi:MAG: DUF3127 domain-containing protein, partial [Pirellulaceae bacterium]
MSDTRIRGRIHAIEPTKMFGQKGFRKRLVVLEQDNGRFVNYIPIDFLGDSCDDVDQLKVGDEIEVRYRLSGRKWQRDAASEVKYFLSAESSEFRKVSDDSGAAPSASPAR